MIVRVLLGLDYFILGVAAGVLVLIVVIGSFRLLQFLLDR